MTLENGARYDVIQYYLLIVSRIRAFYLERQWMTLNGIWNADAVAEFLLNRGIETKSERQGSSYSIWGLRSPTRSPIALVHY